MSDLPAIIGGIALLIGTVFTGLAGLDIRRRRMEQEDREEYEALQRWRPRVRRAVVALLDKLAEHRIAPPPEVEALMVFPPPKPKHAKYDDEVTADDAG